MSDSSAGVSVLFPEPVSHPQLWTSSLVAGATGQVLCEVAEGRVDIITWSKDGQPLAPDRVSWLSSSHSVLYLRPAKRSDCGSYSCNASNRISWQETSLEVTIEGLTSHCSSCSPPFPQDVSVVPPCPCPHPLRCCCLELPLKG